MPTNPRVDEDSDLMYFNGVNASTGDYFTRPMSARVIWGIARGEKLSDTQKGILESRQFEEEKELFAIKEGIDEQSVEQSGWGVIFPAKIEAHTLAGLKEALKELLDFRKEQAGDLYREYSNTDLTTDAKDDGYKPKETADDFLMRLGVGPGVVDPQKVPFYLLIVGHPQAIPYLFQFELDVAYAAGRIYFKTLDEYAQYARSVVASEKEGKVRLPRKAAFFATAHKNDRATQLSSELLVDPLIESLRQNNPDWELASVKPAQAKKARLTRLLGGKDTPALLFTASHGVGFDFGDPKQLDFQGALLCQDWPGPGKMLQPIEEKHYLGAKDIASDASLLGMISVHFACFGAGTPREDSFTKQAQGVRAQLAPSAFLAALPQRLMGHPKGGALAVLGHVDRAWSYSFRWGEAGPQTVTFESLMQRLMNGKRVGTAFDDLNSRYADIAVRLSNYIEQDLEVRRPEYQKLARLWTANNDARGYALLGDPAVKLPLVEEEKQPIERPAIIAVQHRQLRQPQPGERIETEELLRRRPAEGFEEEDFGVRETLEALRANLEQTLRVMTDKLNSFANNVTSLDVATYTSDSLQGAKFDPRTKDFGPQARLAALTHLALDGDTKALIPTEAGELNETVWEVHTRMVEQAQANRVAMFKAAIEVLTSLIPKAGGG